MDGYRHIRIALTEQEPVPHGIAAYQMNKEQAFKIIVRSLEAANLKGAFALNDSAAIAAALGAMNPELPSTATETNAKVEHGTK